MTHNEKRSHWIKEGLIGLGTGVLYGCTSVAVGHPLDTIKTKMQAQHGYIESGGMMKSFIQVWKLDGIKGMYRGCIPPLWGSGLYRSTQFAVFEALYTKWNTPSLTREMPYTGGLQYRVLLAAISASTARAILECPIELAKVKRQTNQSWTFRELYKGFSLQLIRTGGVMTTYFICIDSIRRNKPETFKTVLGQFLASSCSATLGFWIVWPFEVLKNQVQADMPLNNNSTNNNNNNQSKINSPSLVARARYLIAHHGIAGLYRGIWPGTLRSMISNGTSMIVMLYAQRKITEWGWRK